MREWMMKMSFNAKSGKVEVIFPDGRKDYFDMGDPKSIILIGLHQLEAMRDNFRRLKRPVTEELLADIEGYKYMLQHPEVMKQYLDAREERQNNPAAISVRPHHFLRH
jgi:hypothetical protein